jgi:hypothetical protein
MLELRVKQLEKQAHGDFRHHEALLERLVPFVRKEADEKAAEKEVVEKVAAEKEAAEKEAAEKEVAEKEDDDDEEDQAWPSGSSDDDGPVSPIRFPRVMCLLKCHICLNYLYEHKNVLFFHIKSFIKDAMSPPDVVLQHLYLSRLLDMQP